MTAILAKKRGKEKVERVRTRKRESGREKERVRESEIKQEEARESVREKNKERERADNSQHLLILYNKTRHTAIDEKQ